MNKVKINPESVTVTDVQMDTIKKILDYVYESLCPANDLPMDRPDLRVWTLSEYAEKLQLTNDELHDLDKVIKIFA